MSQEARPACVHCGGDHPVAAHYDVMLAQQEADRLAAAGDPKHRLWEAQARLLIQRAARRVLA